MPYNYAHALTGFFARNNCKNLHAVGLPLHEDAFFLGTMGPDPYYGDAFLPPLSGGARTDLADRLHALDGRALFSSLLALSRGSDVRLAYTMGFLCHFLLDNHAHPYVEARFPGKLHTPAEIAMDPMLVMRANEPRLSASPAAFYRLDALFEIDALHTALFSETFRLSTRGVYARAVKKWLRLNALLYDPAGKKLSRLRAFPSLSRYLIAPRPDDGRDLLNLTHAPWAPPWDREHPRTASMPELIGEASAECRLLIDQIAAGEREIALAALEGRTADAARYV